MLAAAVSRMLSSSALVRTKARLLRMSVIRDKGALEIKQRIEDTLERQRGHFVWYWLVQTTMITRYSGDSNVLSGWS